MVDSAATGHGGAARDDNAVVLLVSGDAAVLVIGLRQLRSQLQ